LVTANSISAVSALTDNACSAAKLDAMRSGGDDYKSVANEAGVLEIRRAKLNAMRSGGFDPFSQNFESTQFAVRSTDFSSALVALCLSARFTLRGANYD
jgi:hypothetical protein